MRSSIHLPALFVILFLMLILGGCASAPKASQKTLTFSEAETWLYQHCSLVNGVPLNGASAKELNGDIVMRAKTSEFKGQYPASIHYEPNGTFVMEVTNIIGGTVVRLSGDQSGMELLVPSKPKYNRKNITSYMGIELPLLMQLLHGDLPCPKSVKGERVVKVEKNAILSESAQWNWAFERADEKDGSVPVSIKLTPNAGVANASPQIEMQIDEWDQKNNYAKKVSVKTPQGELKWTWRSRKE